jgi:hypothetical protein
MFFKDMQCFTSIMLLPQSISLIQTMMDLVLASL